MVLSRFLLRSRLQSRLVCGVMCFGVLGGRCSRSASARTSSGMGYGCSSSGASNCCTSNSRWKRRKWRNSSWEIGWISRHDAVDQGLNSRGIDIGWNHCRSMKGREDRFNLADNVRGIRRSSGRQ